MLVAASNFLVPNATFIVEWVIFLAVLGFLAKWVLPPLNRMLEGRQRTIQNALDEAEQATSRARELAEQRRVALDEARQEARSLRDEATKVGEQLRQELQKRGEEEYQRLVSRAAADIEASARKASEALRGQVAGLVMVVVERVLGEGMTVADQQRLIDHAIAEVEAQGHTEAVGAGALAGSPGPGGSR
ncbi:MAG: F0F1 ATP synthase subunit B [Acidimicrobiales bacterium]